MNILHIIKRFLTRIKYLPQFIIQSIKWPYETCQRCGNAYCLIWSVSDGLWNDVIGEKEGLMCIDCFIKEAIKKGIKITDDDFIIKPFYQFEKNEIE